jgi:hypothetical protein
MLKLQIDDKEKEMDKIWQIFPFSQFFGLGPPKKKYFTFEKFKAYYIQKGIIIIQLYQNMLAQASLSPALNGKEQVRWQSSIVEFRCLEMPCVGKNVSVGICSNYIQIVVYN